MQRLRIMHIQKCLAKKDMSIGLDVYIKNKGIKWGFTNFLLYIAICKRVWSLGHGSNNDHHRLTLRYGFFKVLEEAYLGRVP